MEQEVVQTRVVVWTERNWEKPTRASCGRRNVGSRGDRWIVSSISVHMRSDNVIACRRREKGLSGLVNLPRQCSSSDPASRVVLLLRRGKSGAHAVAQGQHTQYKFNHVQHNPSRDRILEQRNQAHNVAVGHCKVGLRCHRECRAEQKQRATRVSHYGAEKRCGEWPLCGVRRTTDVRNSGDGRSDARAAAPVDLKYTCGDEAVGSTLCA